MLAEWARRNPWLALAIVAVVAGLIVAVAAESGPDKDNPYTQTWTKNYGETSCGDWLTVMTERERFVGAGDMLIGARKAGAGTSSLPDEALIAKMEQSVSKVCAADPEGALSVAEIVATLYVMSEPDWR